MDTLISHTMDVTHTPVDRFVAWCKAFHLYTTLQVVIYLLIKFFAPDFSLTLGFFLIALSGPIISSTMSVAVTSSCLRDRVTLTIGALCRGEFETHTDYGRNELIINRPGRRTCVTAADRELLRFPLDRVPMWERVLAEHGLSLKPTRPTRPLFGARLLENASPASDDRCS